MRIRHVFFGLASLVSTAGVGIPAVARADTGAFEHRARVGDIRDDRFGRRVDDRFGRGVDDRFGRGVDDRFGRGPLERRPGDDRGQFARYELRRERRLRELRLRMAERGAARHGARWHAAFEGRDKR